jgi:bleomycin hydrolase
MKRTLLSLAALCLCASLFAQSLGKSELETIRGSFVKDPSTVALQNVISHTGDIASLALRVNPNKVLDDIFKYEVPRLPSAPDQYTSGRCWLFTSLNAIRPYAMEKFNVKDFRFSHNFDSFWDLFEKSNLFLESIILTANEEVTGRAVTELFKTPVGDGAAWNFFLNLAEKYGVAPESAMPETIHSNKTANMRTLLNQKLRREGWNIREMAAAGSTPKEMREYKLEVLKDVYRLLALCLGEPPTEFTWTYQDRDGVSHTIKTTPQEFYKSIVPADYGLESMVMIMNDPTREYYKVYEIENYRNCYEGINWVYLNLPNEEMKAGALATIKDGEAVYASCDWRKGMVKPANSMTCDSYDYDSLFGMEFGMDKKARILTRFSASAHAMLIIACDTDENDKPTKWKFFNSWFDTGEKSTLTFTDEWFDGYIFRLALNRKYLSEKALQALETKHVMLPFWDYMN